MVTNSTEFQTKDLKTLLLPFTDPSLNDADSTSRDKISIITSLLTVILFITSIIMVMTDWLGPQPPVFEINSLSASNVTVSGTKLAAQWATDLSLINPNFALDTSIDKIESTLLYKEDDALSFCSVKGFHVGSREEKNDITMTFATTGYEGDQPVIEYPVLREIEKDQKSGTVRFSLRMRMWARFKTSGRYSWLFSWERRALISFYIMDLNVGFGKLGNNNNGNLIGDRRRSSGILMMLVD